MPEILSIGGIDVRVIRSARRTLTLEVRPDGEAVVRAPATLGTARIRAFLMEKQRWLTAHVSAARERSARAGDQPPMSVPEIRALVKRGMPAFLERLEHYAKALGVTYGRVTLRRMKSRWGSCSAQGGLSFNVALLLAPPEVRDSVAVHELCHRLVMNHSDRFYRYVYSVCPDYDRLHAWLKEHGAGLMARVGISA